MTPQEELVEDIKIDPSQLDVECVQQGELLVKWAQRATEQKYKVENLRLEADRILNSLKIRIRAHPDRFKLDKQTEAAISEVAESHEDYCVVQDELLKARRLLLHLEDAVRAMDGKKKMLEQLVTLHGQQYFAGPSAPRNLVAAWKDHRQEATKRTNAAARQRTRVRREA